MSAAFDDPVDPDEVCEECGLPDWECECVFPGSEPEELFEDEDEPDDPEPTDAEWEQEYEEWMTTQPRP